VWLIGATVCLLAAPWVQLSVSEGNGWPHNALRHHWLMPISFHFRDCKALLVMSLTHVSGATASVQTFATLIKGTITSLAAAEGQRLFFTWPLDYCEHEYSTVLQCDWSTNENIHWNAVFSCGQQLPSW